MLMIVTMNVSVQLALELCGGRGREISSGQRCSQLGWFHATSQGGRCAGTSATN